MKFEMMYVMVLILINSRISRDQTQTKVQRTGIVETKSYLFFFCSCWKLGFFLNVSVWRKFKIFNSNSLSRASNSAKICSLGSTGPNHYSVQDKGHLTQKGAFTLLSFLSFPEEFSPINKVLWQQCCRKSSYIKVHNHYFPFALLAYLKIYITANILNLYIAAHDLAFLCSTCECWWLIQRGLSIPTSELIANTNTLQMLSHFI